VSLPSVSIIMPAYNREAFIGEALASLQSQEGVDADIIVVDDGSTDGTIKAVRGIAAADHRIKLIENRHAGVAVARNTGVRAARGAFLTFLDSDDLCAPGRLQRQIRKLLGRPDITVVTGHSRWFTRMTRDFQPAAGSMWYRRTDPILANAMFRRSVFDVFGMFDESLRFAEDIDFFFRLFEADVRILIEVEIATFYRQHADNMTKNEAAMYRGILAAYHKSIERRRRSGRTRRLEVFFHRPFDEETVLGGQNPQDVIQCPPIR
jgi:glycosyltransferase involved in cell wall biosynthesis